VSRQVTHDGYGALQIRFAFDRRLVDLVKSLSSRRWNPTEKFWWVPESDVVPVVDLLHPEGFALCEATRRLYREHGGMLVLDGERAERARSVLPGLFDGERSDSSATTSAAGSSADFTVSRLNLEVQAALAAAFPAPIWLVGEISGFNKSAHKRIVSFHLVERDGHHKAVAEVSATLFEDIRRQIERQLRAAGDPFRLEDEVTIRMRGRVELYVPWGSYRVIVEDLDLGYTVGEAARRREEILRKLTLEGIIERNRSLPFPPLPLDVALVTSLGSDAYNDVLRTLQESGFAFRVTVHGARVQGRLTEPSILNALDWIRERAGEFHVVLICRGGGSRSDLAWFDSEPLARAVATFPIPVVVGIGHEQDYSALDFVGWRSKTPTAAAGLLVERVGAAEESVEAIAAAVLERCGLILHEERSDALSRGRRLVVAIRALVDRERAELDHRRRRTVRGAGTLLRTARTEVSRRATSVPRAAGFLLGRSLVLLNEAARQLVPRSLRRAATEAERTETRARRLYLVDPRRVVERGYSILRSGDGALLTDPERAPAGTHVRAEMKRGSLRLRSEGPEET